MAHEQGGLQRKRGAQGEAAKCTRCWPVAIQGRKNEGGDLGAHDIVCRVGGAASDELSVKD